MAALNSMPSLQRARAAQALEARPAAENAAPLSEDVALVHAARARDARAQARIWRKYAPLVKAKLRASIGTRDHEDMVQEVFLRLFDCLHALREPAALRSFIIGICLRVAGTELRRRGCHWWLCLMPNDAPCDAPSASHRPDDDAREALARLDAILAKLSPHARRVFELRHVEKKGLAEVADAMGISLATVKRQLARAETHVAAMVAGDEVLRVYAGEADVEKAELPQIAPPAASVAETSAVEDAKNDEAREAEPQAGVRDDVPANDTLPLAAEGNTPRTPLPRVECRVVDIRFALRRRLRDPSRASPPARAIAETALPFARSHCARGPAHRLRAGPRALSSALRARPFGEQPPIDAERRRDLGFDPKAMINELRHLAAA